MQFYKCRRNVKSASAKRVDGETSVLL